MSANTSNKQTMTYLGYIVNVLGSSLRRVELQRANQSLFRFNCSPPSDKVLAKAQSEKERIGETGITLLYPNGPDGSMISGLFNIGINVAGTMYQDGDVQKIVRNTAVTLYEIQPPATTDDEANKMFHQAKQG
mgnify:FL=1